MAPPRLFVCASDMAINATIRHAQEFNDRFNSITADPNIYCAAKHN